MSNVSHFQISDLLVDVKDITALHYVASATDFSSLSPALGDIFYTAAYNSTISHSGAFYRIVDNITPDNITSFPCANEFYAQLIYDDTLLLSICGLGASPEHNNAIMNFALSNDNIKHVIFPAGTFYFTDTFTLSRPMILEGQYENSILDFNTSAFVITASNVILKNFYLHFTGTDITPVIASRNFGNIGLDFWNNTSGSCDVSNVQITSFSTGIIMRISPTTPGTWSGSYRNFSYCDITYCHIGFIAIDGATYNSISNSNFQNCSMHAIYLDTDKYYNILNVHDTAFELCGTEPVNYFPDTTVNDGIYCGHISTLNLNRCYMEVLSVFADTGIINITDTHIHLTNVVCYGTGVINSINSHGSVKNDITSAIDFETRLNRAGLSISPYLSSYNTNAFTATSNTSGSHFVQTPTYRCASARTNTLKFAKISFDITINNTMPSDLFVWARHNISGVTSGSDNGAVYSVPFAKMQPSLNTPLHIEFFKNIRIAASYLPPDQYINNSVAEIFFSESGSSDYTNTNLSAFISNFHLELYADTAITNNNDAYYVKSLINT